MIDLRGVGEILGWVVFSVGLMLLLPAVADLAQDNTDWFAFAFAAGIAIIIGSAMALANTGETAPTLDFRQAFCLIGLGWICVTLFGAIPFVVEGMTLTDAVFETMSGLTTTGSTVLTGLDTAPPGLLLWRALLQWMGGIGIIAVAVLILPFLRVGGMQLFKLETSSNRTDSSAFTKNMLFRLSLVYGGLTALCALTYFLLGMSLFDAITHAMATLSTGGYSTHDASFGYFSDHRLHWAGIVFMICGAIPFVLFVKATLGDVRSIISDQQVRGFLLFLLIASVALALWLMQQRDIGFEAALTLTAFNITSVVTTTGFATEDYTTWGHGAVGVFLVLTFVGGCSGSTSGAIKIYRYQVLWLFVRGHVRRLFSPNRVIVLRYNGVSIGDDVSASVLAFLAVFIATIATFTVVLSLLGLDLVTAYSASVTAISNVGPGLGPIIGPAGNFEPLPDLAKWALITAMLAGRLEILALLVFLERDFWIA